MKIAVLTHPPAKNYGGIMQALALSGALKEMGHECQVVYGPVKKLSAFRQLKEAVRKAFGLGRDKPYRNMMQFVRQNIPVTKPWYGRTVPECDCFIVGSDQVWRPSYTPVPGAYFLDFLPDSSRAVKLSYAASFGVDRWEFSPEQTAEFGKLIRKFDAVSVRESSGVGLCQQHWNCTAVQVPDPTLLHNADFYRAFVPEHLGKLPAGKVLFTYFLDSNSGKERLADDFAAASGLLRDDFLPRKKRISRRPVEEFINGIDKAGFVLTDSFHGMVFSMIFGVPFAVIGNAKRGMSRFELALKAGVPEVILDENAAADDLLKLASDVLRYKKIAEFLASEQSRGRDFLKQQLVK